MFSEIPEQWRLPMTRWVTGTRPDQDGRFKVQNLPAGSYWRSRSTTCRRASGAIRSCSTA